MIVLVGGEKGGTGKTTLAVNLAAMRAAEGRDVLLVDCDPQATCTFWADIRSEMEGITPIPSVQKLGSSIAKDLKDLATRYDDLIIDAGGRDSAELRAGLVVADRFVSPVQPSQFDTWTLAQLSELVNNVRAINAELDSCLVLARVSTNPVIREADEAREFLAEFPFEVLETPIHERIVYRKASRDGLAVTEYQPVDEKAKAEMKAVYKRAFE